MDDISFLEASCKYYKGRVQCKAVETAGYNQENEHRVQSFRDGKKQSGK